MIRLMAAQALFGLAASAIFLAFPNQLMLIFGSAKESTYYTEFAVWFIRCQLFLLPLACVNKASFIFLQALGKPRQASVLSVSREFILGVGFTLLLPMIGGLYALPFFMPAADTVTFIAVAVVLLRVNKELETPITVKEQNEEKFIPSSEPPLTDYIITIGRSYGSGGRSVGKLLAEKLNIPYYDAALLEETAKHSGLNQKYLASMDEKSVGANGLYQYMGFNFGHDSNFENLASQAQQEVIKITAQKGPCIIIGRRADQILHKTDKMLTVFITASVETRAKRVSERDGISLEESRGKIAKVDQERAAYYNQYSDSKWGSANTYDLCLDTDKLGIEGAVNIILNAVEQLNANA